MKKIEVNPNQIGIWVGCVKDYKEPLEDIILKDGWKDIPRVPIFELPKGCKHKYVLVDGHGRRNAAIKTKTLLPCVLYSPDETIDVKRDGLAPFGFQDQCSNANFYEKVVQIYLHYLSTRLRH